MHLKESLICLLVLFFAIGCRPSESTLAGMEKDKREVIHKATNEIPYMKEFQDMFPTAAVKLYTHNFKKGTTSIQVADVIYDRYVLTLTIEIEVDPKQLTVTSVAVPLITLLEVTSVDGDANGPLNVKHGSNVRISVDQWRKIVESRGRMSVAGIEVKTDEPIAGISELKTHIRRIGLE